MWYKNHTMKNLLSDFVRAIPDILGLLAFLYLLVRPLFGFFLKMLRIANF